MAEETRTNQNRKRRAKTLNVKKIAEEFEIRSLDADFSMIPECAYRKIENIANSMKLQIEGKERMLTATLTEDACDIELFNGVRHISSKPERFRKDLNRPPFVMHIMPSNAKGEKLVYELTLYSYCPRRPRNSGTSKAEAFYNEFGCQITRLAHPCRVTMAIYYNYLKTYKPEELKRQREKYRKDKDDIDAQLLAYNFGVPISLEDFPHISTKRIKEIRENIDDGVYTLHDNYFEKYSDGKILTTTFLRNADRPNGFSNLSEMLTGWIISPNGHPFYLENQEIMQSYFIMFLLKEGKYKEYVKAQAEYEAGLEDIELGSSYFGCVTGNDAQAVTEKAKQICMRVIQEKLPEQTQNFEIRMFSLAESIAQMVSEVPGMIRYTPLQTGKVFLITGIREFITMQKANTPDSIYGRQISHLLKELEQFKDNQFIVLAGTEGEIKEFFSLDRTLELKFGQHVTNIPDMTVDELYDSYKEKLPNNITLTEENETEFKDYLAYNLGALPLKNTALVNYLVSLATEEGKFAMPKNLSDAKRKDFMQDLNDVVGMENIKKSIVDFYNYARFQKAAKDLGADIPRGNMHMVFTGNAGTGKTMTANIIAKALYDIGVVKENKVVVAERKDLVGEYIGHTAVKTSEVIEKALGGVLFIDEAYSLNAGASSGNTKDFGSEAIATLLTAMENHRDELIVIFAGYKKEMAEFIDMNPGIASRVGYTFNFKDYDENELVEIFKKKVIKAGLTLNEDAVKPAKTLMQYFGRIPNIGNGRFAEKVCQLAIRKHANQADTATFLEISAKDIPTVKEVLEVLPDGENMINPEEISDDSKKKTAYHELGHAFVGIKVGETVKKITIEPSGMGWLGYVEYAPGMPESTRERLIGDISRCLAGMAAEKVFIGGHGAGVSDDLKKAKSIAKSMVTEYGMGSMLSIPDDKVNDEVEKLLQEGLSNAVEMIKNNKGLIEKASTILLKEGTLDGEKANKIFEGLE